MPTYEITPQNVCSASMSVTVNDGIIEDLQVVRGCHGNLQGISALVKGMKVDDVIARLEGIACRGSRTKETSCPDQLAQGLKKLKAEGKI